MIKRKADPFLIIFELLRVIYLEKKFTLYEVNWRCR